MHTHNLSEHFAGKTPDTLEIYLTSISQCLGYSQGFKHMILHFEDLSRQYQHVIGLERSPCEFAQMQLR